MWLPLRSGTGLRSTTFSPGRTPLTTTASPPRTMFTFDPAEDDGVVFLDDEGVGAVGAAHHRRGRNDQDVLAGPHLEAGAENWPGQSLWSLFSKTALSFTVPVDWSMALSIATSLPSAILVRPSLA